MYDNLLTYWGITYSYVIIICIYNIYVTWFVKRDHFSQNICDLICEKSTVKTSQKTVLYTYSCYIWITILYVCKTVYKFTNKVINFLREVKHNKNLLKYSNFIQNLNKHHTINDNYSICMQNCFWYLLTIFFFTNKVINVLTEVVLFSKSGHTHIYIYIRDLICN